MINVRFDAFRWHLNATSTLIRRFREPMATLVVEPDKRVYRIYCALELNLRIKPRKRLKRDKPDALAVPEAPSITWLMDFMADRLGDWGTFRLLNVLDDFNREGLGIEIDFSLLAERVIRSFDRIIEWRGKPGMGRRRMSRRWRSSWHPKKAALSAGRILRSAAWRTSTWVGKGLGQSVIASPGCRACDRFCLTPEAAVGRAGRFCCVPKLGGLVSSSTDIGACARALSGRLC